ncbi:hypothetical protein ACH5AO_11275 [Streptomyces sp. NPDC018964]|uniref:hypothetical protein n=1 Tax=Streptomyces sp. NPDC018964 TaxID=3365058 RepID=UPI003795D615
MMIRVDGTTSQYAAAKAALAVHAKRAGWPPRTPVQIRFYRTDVGSSPRAFTGLFDGRCVIALDVSLDELGVYDHCKQAINDLVAKLKEHS